MQMQGRFLAGEELQAFEVDRAMLQEVMSVCWKAGELSYM